MAAAAGGDGAAAAPKSSAKLDELRELEKAVQARWRDGKVFEANPEDSSREKWFGTFPFPYLNGRLHLGHTFSVTKVEFAAQYERLKGKNVLFPFAFHVTGMPIAACADKLKREIEVYGNPPKFPSMEERRAAAEAAAAEKEGVVKDVTQHKAAKSKVAQKGGGGDVPKFQWEIMQSLGVSDADIPAFADTAHWLEFFPPYCKSDLEMMGAGVDWRRSFITTDANPYYDSFVRWQFEHLREKEKIKFGKRYAVFSPKDGQPCMDHDRSKGEGVGPQEYTLIKLQLVEEDFPESFAPLKGKWKVYLVPGTLRPETMYGQTNCWLLPEGRYGVFASHVPGEAFVCTARAARNMAYQGLSPAEGTVEELVEGGVTGMDLMGKRLIAPHAKYEHIYTLPMASVSMNKGTGVVTSVPSDAPDDYINFVVLKRKVEYRERFGIKPHMIDPIEVVEIIQCPTLGTCSARTTCEAKKIESGGQRELLDEAKDECYKEGFYKGTMLVGEMAGKPVSEAKPVIRQQMIDAGQAVAYAEPNGVVVSRSGDDCVVALVDQWYLHYGEEAWKQQLLDHSKGMNFFSTEARSTMEAAMDWLHEWACSRTYGLGTRLPWDEQYLIDSLSDSTIYMAFYTVAHKLLGGIVDGSKPGPANVKPEQLNRAVWDYILLEGDEKAEVPAAATASGISAETLRELRSEFRYWYPLDLRVSGKDLIGNHLVFFLYNHLAIFGEELAPRAVRANGFVLLDGKKMSKSDGNFLTLSEGVEEYSADGMRLTLADAGDALDDANFARSTATHSLLRLHAQLVWTKEYITDMALGADGKLTEPRDLPVLGAGGAAAGAAADAAPWGGAHPLDVAFAARIDRAIRDTDAEYTAANFRQATQTGFFLLQAARDSYIEHCALAKIRASASLVRRFIEVQAVLIAPITPHLSEHIWTLLGHAEGDSVLFGTWPATLTAESDVAALTMGDWIDTTLSELRRKAGLFTRKGAKIVSAVLGIAAEFPGWQKAALDTLAAEHPEGTTTAKGVKDLMRPLNSHDAFKKGPKVKMAFVAERLKNFTATGGDRSLFQSDAQAALGFDEAAVSTQLKTLFAATLGIDTVTIGEPASNAAPGAPSIVFSSDE